MLSLQNITVAYDDINVLKNVNATFEKGRFYGILGPNGSGKTTLLKVLSNVLKPKEGSVLLSNQPIEQYKAKQLAKVMSVLPQLNASSFSNTVRETVAIGRYPHQSGLFSTWSQQDEEAVQLAMEQTGVKQFEHMPLPFLSGGEQQRVFIAQALAQQATILLLDEPTNHLDITHQKQALDIIRKKVVEEQLTVIAVFHDINLASIYCDTILLMENGHIRKVGTPSEVVVQREIEQVYEATIATYAHPQIPKPQITMLPMQESTLFEVNERHVLLKKNGVFLQAPQPLKTISSAVYNAGIGWYKTFVNRMVNAQYEFSQVEQEVEQFLLAEQMEKTESVVMMTAIDPSNAIIKTYKQDELSILVVVTAGVGNAIDASKANLRNEKPYAGTINTWVMINGKLTNEAFVQAMITATEAKSKALQEEQIFDKVSETIATGTGTDSLLIAATQSGQSYPYAGPLTTLGQLIGYSVCDATRKAIQNYKRKSGVK